MSIALDDVGLGQSNYKMILDVRPDIYKLDRYLVSSAWNDRYRQVILDSLARMVRRLEARAVAEGVETAQELGGRRGRRHRPRAGLLLRAAADAATTWCRPAISTGRAPVGVLGVTPRVLVLDDDPAVLLAAAHLLRRPRLVRRGRAPTRPPRSAWRRSDARSTP